jgi:hypothetical protein
MMRSEIDLSPQRPSRLSRVVVLVATLGVVIITVWVFVPILLTRYTASTASLADAPKPRAIARQVAPPPAPATAVAADPVPAAAAPATVAAVPAAPAARGATDTDASARPDDAGQPATTATAPAPPPAAPESAGFNIAASTPGWPTNPATAPPPAPAAAATQAAPDPDMQLASVPPATAEPIANVPLPRSRPSRMIAARLAIPLPRPRPDIASDDPPPEDAAFERAVERMR